MTLATMIDGQRRVGLSEVDPAADGGLTEREGERQLAVLQGELRELQELAFAAETHGVLVVLQGMDASGKDVTIQQTFATATAEATRVKHFKSMTEEEAGHDFLWRAHAATPAKGEWVIFDRSYYEQAVMPQVLGEASEGESRDRCEDIVAFERILGRGGTILVKVFLNVGNAEQERRLAEREADDGSAWKISARDWEARERWDAYMAAYDSTLNGTATPEAPWHVVPADKPWVHTLAVAEVLVGTLRPYREAWLAERTRIGEEKRAEARAARGERGNGEQ
ncbi:MAG: Polyphosphate kinase 2 [uncultured Thermomicrobiales bacterium]|uniref:Polyphosphate kinase 2 n=1 Tax=uncultured Thermomicrobiales bacterium TaxID=1645740 RepID=A0A6J4V5W8_9BACT|nr:MAG: Polyphosphate kinase 2 [uncultured Thermomicrobiales bacterium]